MLYCYYIYIYTHLARCKYIYVYIHIEVFIYICMYVRPSLADLPQGLSWAGSSAIVRAVVTAEVLRRLLQTAILPSERINKSVSRRFAKTTNQRTHCIH